MSYQIETNMPIPNNHKGKGRAPKYPWRELALGESFFVPASDIRRVVLSTCATSAGRRLKRKFITRTVDSNGCAGTRVWRVL